MLTLVSLTHAVSAGSATWDLNPTNNDWNTAANWTPATVPDSPTDVATFGVSNLTAISFSEMTTVGSIVFNPGASAYNISPPGVMFIGQMGGLTVSGAGIVNNSGIMQNFTAMGASSNDIRTVTFTKSATSGAGVVYNLGANGAVLFANTTTADQSSFMCHANGGGVLFHDSATAERAVFTIDGGAGAGNFGGGVTFYDNSTAASAVFTINASTADSRDNFGTSGSVNFYDGSKIDDGFLVAEGGTVAGAAGGEINFYEFSNAGNALLVANGGQNDGLGGVIFITSQASGSTAQIEIFGNGALVTNGVASVVIGSLEGDGLVNLGPSGLTIGSNNLNTLFSGVISPNQISGALTKIGTGRLTLSRANGYTGGTTIMAGSLVATNRTGSATGSGPVQVNGGTLGGSGTLAGAVTINAGGILAPAHGAGRQVTLTMQSALTFNAGSTYTYTAKAKMDKAKADKVIAKGVTINNGATFNFSGIIQGTLSQGLVFTLISNTATTPISGTFGNLPDGAIITVGGNNLQANYEGGDGNDLTLTVVP